MWMTLKDVRCQTWFDGMTDCFKHQSKHLASIIDQLSKEQFFPNVMGQISHSFSGASDFVVTTSLGSFGVRKRDASGDDYTVTKGGDGVWQCNCDLDHICPHIAIVAITTNEIVFGSGGNGDQFLLRQIPTPLHVAPVVETLKNLRFQLPLKSKLESTDIKPHPILVRKRGGQQKRRYASWTESQRGSRSRARKMYLLCMIHLTDAKLCL